MMYNENLHEEEQHLIQQIAEQTERGKIDWELTEYNPLSFLNEDKIDKNPAVICQSFSFEAIIGGSRYELDVMENIDVPSGMGDYTITLTRDETENFLKIEDALSFDCDRYECTCLLYTSFLISKVCQSSTQRFPRFSELSSLMKRKYQSSTRSKIQW